MDKATLGGLHPETCYGRYGAMPIQRAGYLQELALQILLYHLSVVAGQYSRTIKPVLSVGMAFYCRVFVEVYDNKAGVRYSYVPFLCLPLSKELDPIFRFRVTHILLLQSRCDVG
jgi:tRNA G26 N,N-dimethylase Trm1